MPGPSTTGTAVQPVVPSGAGAISGISELFSTLGFAAAGTADVFAANRQQVFVTHDLGSSWSVASGGLPAVAQVYDLHYVPQPDGSRYLYLASWGWSMFRARLPNP